MAIVNIHWNLVKCVQAANLETLAKGSAISYHPNVEPSCRGVYFRSILTEELDFSETLKGLKFDDPQRDGTNKGIRRTRDGAAAPFVPKPISERSVGVLRVMRPKRFNAPKGINVSSQSVNMVSRSKDYDVILETTEFILEDAQEQMQERFQLQETFGDFNVFFFGKRAEIFTYSGSLLNGCKDLQWRSQFLANYEKYLRGTRCVELKARVYFLYDDIIREGFILAASLGQNSTVDGVVKFTFTMLITDKRTMGYIPENVEAKPLTLDRSGETKHGITDFRFFRSKDPNLPLVAEGVAISDDGAEIPQGNIDAVFVPDESLPGENPPEDLRVQMQNLTLQALSELGGGQDVVKISDESLDSDILLEFIHNDKLGYNTKLKSSGKKSLDVENLGGDELVLLLTSNPPGIALSSLRFKQAVDVARSFSDKNAALAGEPATKLGELASFFAPKGEFRTVEQREKTSDYKAIFSTDKNYILLQARDDDYLDALITAVKPITDFKKDALVKSAIDTVHVSAVKHFLQKDKGSAVQDNETIELYVAALALLRHPSTTNALASFSQFAGTVGGHANSIDYVRAQTFSKYAAVAGSLPGDFRQALEASIANFKMCGLVGWIKEVFPDRRIEEINLSEFTLLQATVGAGTPASEESVKFMMQSSVYVSGIVAERLKSIVKTSFDITGSTVMNAPDPVSAGGIYFTQAYADRLKPGTDKVLEAVWIDLTKTGFSGVQGSSVFGDTWFEVPVGLVKPKEVLFGLNTIVITNDPIQQRIVAAGYPRVLTPDLSKFNKHIILEAEIRKPGSKAPSGLLLGSTVHRGAANLESGNHIPSSSPWQFSSGRQLRLSTGREITTAVLLDKYPVARRYIGGAEEVQYSDPTLNHLVQAAVTEVGSFVTSAIPKISDAIKKSVELFISEGIPQDVDQKPIREELAIGKLSSNAEIASLNTAVSNVGAIAGDLIDLLFVAEEEKDMAKKISELKDLIQKAIDNSKEDAATGGKADNVANSDAATKKAICHAK
jgi:hypothetical protein